jgi:hypothetical protein
MQLLGGGSRAEQLIRQPRPRVILHTRLDPEHVDIVAGEVGDRADAVAGAHHLLERAGQLVPRQVFVNDLAYLEGRLDRERELGCYTERAQVHHSSCELRRGVIDPHLIAAAGIKLMPVTAEAND